MNYCSYYQAHVRPTDGWFLTGVLRSFEHLAFDRTLDTPASIFEFFVPIEQECYFIQIMDYLNKQGIVTNLQKLPNRLLDQDAKL